MHAVAGKAVAFGEALQPEFKEYAQQRSSRTAGNWQTACSKEASTSSPAGRTTI
jgi:glycine/serine hydroxymethyltransferase